jgi:hypothetical protein
MLVTHELGHVIGAWMSGGRVLSVSIPLVGFSQTIVHPNPHDVFETWCGPVIGSILPALVLLVVRAVQRRMPTLLGLFAGFCLIANGAYLGIGWIWRAGDAGDLVRLGAPVWVLLGSGAVGVTSGLLCWHRTPGLSFRRR